MQVSIEFLQPITVVSRPNNSVPQIPPIDTNEPIHPASSYVTAPVCNGDVSDNKIGSDGDIHPTAQPCARQIIFAKNKLK